jgi:hypothetical protein
VFSVTRFELFFICAAEASSVHASSKDSQQQALIVLKKAVSGKALDSAHVYSDGKFRNISSVSQRRKGREGRKAVNEVRRWTLVLCTYMSLICFVHCHRVNVEIHFLESRVE